MAEYDQKLAEQTINHMLQQRGYEVLPGTNIGANTVFIAEQEGRGARFIVRYMPIDSAYENSPLPYSVYKIYCGSDLFLSEEREKVDFLVGYNPIDRSFACVPITEFDKVRNIVVHQREGLRSEYYNSWELLDGKQNENVDLGEPNQWYKGLTSLSGYTDALIHVTEVAEGTPTETFKEQVQLLFPTLKDSSSISNYINMVRQLGLIEQKGIFWSRTDVGNHYLDTRSPEVLRPILLRRYASIYKILWELRKDGKMKREYLQHILGEYLGWTSTFGTAAQVRWCDSLGLVQIEDGMIWLTQRGVDWAHDLTDEPPRFAVSISREKKSSAQPAPATYTFDFSLIQDRIKAMKLIYNNDLLPGFHAALHALSYKHFAILSGISGTGKTKLVQAYANAVYGLELNEDNPHLLIVAVQPQWNDATSLVGYFSPITMQYYRTAFLDFLIKAVHDETAGIPYFVCMDEMNLAMVEHYFSDFLSAWESGAPLELYAGDNLVSDTPRQLKIPRNLYVIGTVNVDESTHSFSKKVLDRAFVFELADVDYDGYVNSRTENLQVKKLVSIVKYVGQKMKPFHLHVGYRVLDEMASYIEKYPLVIDDEGVIDNLMLQKVLPRISGDERILTALIETRQFLVEELGYHSASVTRLNEMIGELESTGMCQFWR